MCMCMLTAVYVIRLHVALTFVTGILNKKLIAKWFIWLEVNY